MGVAGAPPDHGSTAPTGGAGSRVPSVTLDLTEGERHLLDVLPAATVVLGVDGVVRHANTAAATVLGTPAEQLVGRPLAASRLDLDRGRLLVGGGDARGVTFELQVGDLAWEGAPALLATLRPAGHAEVGTSGAGVDAAALLGAARHLVEVCARAGGPDEAAGPVVEVVRAATAGGAVDLERADDDGAAVELLARATAAGLTTGAMVPGGPAPMSRQRTGAVLRTGHLVVVDEGPGADVATPSPATSPPSHADPSEGHRSWIGAPIVGAGRPWGVLSMTRGRPGAVEPWERELVALAAASFGALVERAAARAAQADSEARFARLAEHAPDVLFRSSAGEAGRFTYVSPSCEVLTGYAPEELLDGTWDLVRLTVPEDRPTVRDLVEQPTPHAVRRVRWVRDDGSVVPVELRCSPYVDASGALGLEGLVRDAGERETFEAELAARALRDPLTGLANRALFYERAHQIGVRRARRGALSAVLFVDLDGFKGINDSLGHSAGDHVLREIGQRLRRSVRPADTVARLGGDEFAVLCEDLANEDDAVAVALRVVEDAGRAVTYGDRELAVGASVGVAMIGPGVTGDEAVRRADMAMYRAKTAGRGRAVLFDGDMAAELEQLVGHQRDLRASLARGDFELRYRPEVDVRDGTLLGAAAVLRWHHPSGRMLTPPEFLAAADDAEVALALASWALHDAAGHARRWVDAPSGWQVLVSVDLSPRQVQLPQLVEVVRGALAAHDLEPQHLCLEVSEEVLAPRPEVAVARLAALRDLGVVLSLNGFGTGNSSLRLLRDLPIHRLKIDASLIAGLGADAIDTAIVRAIVDLGRDLWLTVVAEGVSTVGQLEVLRSFGCPRAQGELFSSTLTMEQMGEVVDGGRLDIDR